MDQKTHLEPSPEEIVALKAMSTDQKERFRRLLDYDPWIFGCKICNHGDGWIESFHRPLMYWFAGHAELLIKSLKRYDSIVVDRIKSEFRRLGLFDGRRYDTKRIRRYLQRINTRISRSMSKTVTELDAILWAVSRTPDAITKGPDESIGLATKSPDNIIKFFDQMNLVLRSDAYTFFYPDRIPPKNLDQYWTQTSITLWGRSIVATEATIEGKSLVGGWTSGHYSWIVGDDIVGTESEDADIERAIKWLAALRGISRAGYLGGTRFLFTGTIYGPDDDHAYITSDWHTPSLVVPIWIKERYSIEAIMDDGKPVLPEWYDIEDIRRIRSETMARPNGLISFLQNFELTAHEIGSTLFTRDAIERQRMLRLPDGFLAHPKRGIPNDGVYKPESWIKVNPKALPAYMGIDQSVSLKKGADSWSVAIVLVNEQSYYVYKVVKGKGYKSMLFWAEKLFKEHLPLRIGMDTAGQQAITLEWMQSSDVFRAMSGLIEPLQSSDRSKEDRLRAFFSTRLDSGHLWLAPGQPELESEMAHYRPGPKAIDDQLDAVANAIAVSLPDVVSTSEMDVLSINAQHNMKKHIDEYGVPLDTWLSMV